MRTSRLLAVAVLALGLGACKSNTFGFRDERCDPDVRLAELLDDWRALKAGTCVKQGRAVVDCDHLRNDIETLSFEFPSHIPSLLANASIAFEMREPEKSRRYLDRLFAITASHPDAAVLHARLSLAEGNLEGARRRVDQQLELRPDHAGLRETQASLAYLARELETAERALATAERLGAPSWRSDYHRGLIAEARGQTAQSMVFYERALAAQPDFVEAHSRLEGLRAAN